MTLVVAGILVSIGGGGWSLRVRAKADLRDAQLLGFVGLALVGLGTAFLFWDLTLKRDLVFVGGAGLAALVFGIAAMARRKDRGAPP